MVIYSQVEPFLGVPAEDVVEAIRRDPSSRHELPAWTDTVARGVIGQCWEADPAARPTFDQIRDVLSGWFCGGEVGGAATDAYLV